MIPKVKKGQKLTIKAESWNAIATAVNNAQAGPGLSAGSNRLAGDSDTVVVRNDSGADCERFDILGIADVLITPTDNLQEFQQRLAVSGVTPVYDVHGPRIVVLQEPIVAGELGRAALSRPTVVRVNVIIEGDMTAGIDDGDATRLTSGGPIPMLWKESGTGEKWAIVDLGRQHGEVLPVLLSQVGGADGTNQIIASWTYMATTLGGDQLYAAIDILQTIEPAVYKPEHVFRRPALGSITPASFGLLYLTGLTSPRWGLLWCNEVPVVEAC